MLEQGLEGFGRWGRSFGLVGGPLGEVQCRGAWGIYELRAEPVEAFEGTHGGGADGHNRRAGSKEALEQPARNDNALAVHGVRADAVPFDGKECAGADVEGGA